MPDPRDLHRATLTAREALLFEAGIKLGGIFHQYLGVPVAPGTARSLERAIEEAVKLQPYVERIRVHIDPSRGGPTGAGRLAYGYLTAEMLRVDLLLSEGELEVRARLAYREDLRYPLMQVREVSRRRARPVPAVPRSGRTTGRRRRRSGRSAGSAGGPGTPRGRGRSTRPRGSRRRAA